MFRLFPAAPGHVIKATVWLERVSSSVTGRRPPLLGHVLLLRPTPSDPFQWTRVVVEEPGGPEEQGSGGTGASQQGGPGSDPARLMEYSRGAEGKNKP